MFKEKMATDFSGEENLESEKQAGCMSGIFQLFDCQQLMGGRQFRGYRKDTSGNVPISPSNQGSDFSKSCNLEKNLSRRYQENPRSSVESSRTSFSSSFTSFSSLEHKSPEEEPAYHSSVFSGRSPRTRSVDNNQSPPAFKDIIKESIHKDFRRASVDGEGHKKNKVLKPIDSPRPMDLLKFKELDESLRILMKLQESSWKFYEGESPRISCDGREILQSFLDSKQTANSKEGLLRCNFLRKELDKIAIQRSADSDQLHHLETNENNPSIVAKLMGLEPINPAAQSGIRCCDPENKHDKPSQSPRNNLKALRISKQLLESSSEFSDGDTPKMALGYVEANVKKKIGSVYSGMENGMQKKLQFQHSNKEIQDLKMAILESRKKCNWKLSSVNSLIHKSNKASISDRTLKSPIVVMEPASKSGISFCPITKHEGPPTLGKIRTSNSTNRKKDLLNFQADGEQTTKEKKANRRNPHQLSKEQSERAVNNTISPQLQQMKPDHQKKDYLVTPYDSKMSRRQTPNIESSDSVSPRCKIRHPSKSKDNELQISGNKINVEAEQTSSSTEGKSDFFQQNIQSPSVKVGTTAASVTENKIHPTILKHLSAKELEMVATQQRSPNSVLDASLKQDDLPHSQVPVSNAFKGHQNLPSDHSLNTAYQSRASKIDAQKPESMDTFIRGSEVLRTNDELSMTNATLLTLGNHNQENPFESEAFLASGLLLKELDLISTLQQTNSDKPSESSENSNTKKLQQKLFFDVVNEILARRFSSGGQHDHMLQSKFSRVKHLNKELCTEIKCLENSKDLDDNSILRNDLLWQSQAWDASESQVPVIVLEIERLIFKDLINEVVGGESAVVLEAKRRRHRRQLLAKSGI